MKTLTKLCILIWILQIMACAKLPKNPIPNEYTFFVGTATGEKSEGIYSFNLNTTTGACSFRAKKVGIINPSFLTITPDNKYLYTVQREEGVAENKVSAFSIDGNLNLKLINTVSTKGQGACYLSTTHSGNNILVAHYTSGSVVVLPVKKDGSLDNVSDLLQHEGSSVDKKRQQGPHAHYIEQGLGDVIYAADLGTDKIMLYDLNNNKLSPSKTKFLKLPPGAGPRHISTHPNQNFLYVLNEMGGSVSVFGFDKIESTYQLKQTISSLPIDFEGYNKSADIHVHPSGKFLFASNRGDYNSIATYKIDETNGMLTLVEIENESIVWPRNFAISPDGKFLLCANLKDDSISVFAIDQLTGALTFTGHKITVLKPMCVKFLGA